VIGRLARMGDDMAIVTAFLADRHVACPACGYDLHGAADGRCPECGKACHIGIVPDPNSSGPVHRVLRVAAMMLITYGAVWVVYYPANMIAYGAGFMGSPGTIMHIGVCLFGLFAGILGLRTLKQSRPREARTLIVCRLLTIWLVASTVQALTALLLGFPWWIFRAR
jgi:hypothetical protein